MDLIELSQTALLLSGITGVIGLYVTLGVCSAYVGSLWAAKSLSDFFSKKIKTQGELEEAVQKEAAKLDLGDINIGAVLHEDYRGAATRINPKNWVVKVGGLGATYSTLRHELFHIKTTTESGEFKSGLRGYLFDDEPKAILYEITGIKII